MNNIYAKEVSIIVTTHNRPKFLKIFSSTLENLNFGGHLIIAESSDIKTYNQSEHYLKPIKKFKITHISIPKKDGESISQSINKCFLEGISKIDTKYSMLTCDDDIPVPSTLEKSQNFLNSNQTYNGICGDYVFFDSDSNFRNSSFGPKLLINIIEKFWKLKNGRTRLGLRNLQQISNPIESNSADGRLEEYIKSFFHTMFVLVRSDTHKKIIPSNYMTITFPHFIADYNWMFTIAIAGKIKKITLPQIIRIHHGENLSSQDNHPYPKLSDAITQSYWGPDSLKFIDNITEVLKSFSSMPKLKLKSLAREAYLKMIIKRIEWDLDGPFKPNYTKLQKLRNVIVYRLIIFKRCNIYSQVTKEIIKAMETPQKYHK